MTSGASTSDLGDRVGKIFTFLRWARWGGLVLLPPLGALLAAQAAVNTGPARLNFSLGTAFVALGLATLQIFGEYQEWKANKAQVNAKIALAGVLTQEARPLINSLAAAADARNETERRAEVTALIAKAVSIARSQCGKLTGARCNTRSAFYEFTSDRQLSRVRYEGRGDRIPRQLFKATKEESHANDVISRARGENTILFKNLDDPNLEPKHSEHNADRDYKTLAMVPVRTARRSYGFLAVDSDKPRTLTDTDVGYVALLAGVIATGIALLDEPYPHFSGLGTNRQRQQN